MRPAIAILTALLLVACGTGSPLPPSMPPVAGPTYTPIPAQTPLPSASPPAATPAPTRPTAPTLLRTLQLLDLPAVGHGPNGVALLDGWAYICNIGSHNVSIVVGNRVRAAVAVGRYPNAIAADPGTRRVFVSNPTDRTLSVLEGESLVATWPLPIQPGALGLVGRELWVGSSNDGRILRLAPRDGSQIGELALADVTSILTILDAPDVHRVYVATYGRIHAIDPSTLREVARMAQNSYRALAVSPMGKWVYTTEYDSKAQQSYLLILDAERLNLARRVPVLADSSDVAVDPRNGQVFVLSSYTNRLQVFDGQDHRLITNLGMGSGPRHMALDAEFAQLVVTNDSGDSVTIVDADALKVVATVPLALKSASIASDPRTGRLYVAARSADQVFVLDETGPVDGWMPIRQPDQVHVLPESDQVAVLSSSEATLAIVDRGGQVIARYATQPGARNLMVDASQQRIYAGETVVDTTRQLTRTLRVPIPYGLSPGPPRTQAPEKLVRDTRRDLLYAIASNGIPGSNAGYVVLPLDKEGNYREAPVPGKLSVVDLIYDEEQDRFYTTNARMGTYSLQVSEAENAKQILELALNRYPAAMVLNPATRHLWVAMPARNPDTEGHNSTLVAFDTRTFGRAATLQLDGLVEALAIDSRADRVYMAADTGILYVIQDVAMPAPPAPTLTLTPTPWPTSTPTAAPSRSPS